MNLQIVNGTDITQTVDGTGNLIIGYNELAEGVGVNDRSGSHMLVIGESNNYSAFGGMVVGEFNTVNGQFASVTGGLFNTAGGRNTFVTGGSGNTALEEITSVFGGGAELSVLRQDMAVVNEFMLYYLNSLTHPSFVRQELDALNDFVNDYQNILGSPSDVLQIFCELDPTGLFACPPPP